MVRCAPGRSRYSAMKSFFLQIFSGSFMASQDKPINLSDRFRANVKVSFVGNGFSQCVLFLGTFLLLFQAYEPVQFGIFGLFSAFAMIIARISTGRYEALIPIPGQDHQATHFLCAAGLICLGTAGVTALVLLFWIPPLLVGIGDWIMLLPLQVLICGLSFVAQQWLARRGRFGILATAEAARACLTILMQWGLAASFGLSATGLILGLVGGWAVYAMVTLPLVAIDVARMMPGMGAVWTSVIEHRRNLLLVPAQGLNTLSTNMPIFILDAMFGAAVAGSYVMASRLLYGPLALIGEPLRAVFFPTASQQFASLGQCRNLFKSVCRVSCLASLLIFIPLWIGAPWIITELSHLLGQPSEKWAVAGSIVQILAPFYMLQLINGPVSGMWITAGRQQLQFVWQIGFFVCITLGMLAGSDLNFSFVGAMYGYGVAKSVAFTVNLWCCWRFACGRNVFARLGS